MEKIKDIDRITLINGNCLIEIEGTHKGEGVFNDTTTSGLYVGNTSYHKNVHVLRYGKLARLPDKINWNKMRWKTDSFPELGSEVWFDYLAAHDPELLRADDKIYLVLKYQSIIVARSSSGDIKLLNGYLLAQKHPKKGSEIFEHKQQYYDDVYDIKFDGKPNLSYKDEDDLRGNTRQVFEDKSIMAGGTYMTKASAYPVLEEYPHNKFSTETYYYFQRKDIIARVDDVQ